MLRALDPALFPRDAQLIDAQGGLMLFDQVLAAIVGRGIPIEAVFFGAYLASLALIGAGVVWAGTRLYASPWAIAAAGAAITLRHHIPGTSANSLEPYFHPRMLAFGIGVVALAALLNRRRWLALVLVAAAAIVHVTTALWFGVLIGVAIAVLDRRLRVVVLAGAATAACVIAWAVTAGPLRQSLTVMDAIWLQAVAVKDSLFAAQWPWSAWAVNLGMLGLLWWALRARRSDDAEHRAVAWGATALVALFLTTLPLVEMRLALPVQLQISRVFWIVELVAVLYLVGALERHARTLAIVLLAAASARGAYIMLVERPERPLFELSLADTEWHAAMSWIRRQPIDTHVLADPGHAWRYGTSVRVSAGRDVFLEDVKDSAIAIYARSVAARVVERLEAVREFPALSPEQARALAGKYDLDLIVTESDMSLPLAYRNSRFRIYNLNK